MNTVMNLWVHKMWGISWLVLHLLSVAGLLHGLIELAGHWSCVIQH
jgi:hypothetical protein